MVFKDLELLIKDHEITHHTRFHKKSYVDDQVDIFVHLDMKTLKDLAKKYKDTISDDEFKQLMTHKYHEYRMVALLIIVYRIRDDKSLKEMFTLYNQYIDYVNNWDLVDASAPTIVGQYVLKSNQEQILFDYVSSDNMWINRIASVSCLYMIKRGYVDLALKVINKLLTHPHDLMHKANGWMLREIGKQDISKLNYFIKKHYEIMPRTTLRYAIERHDKLIRKKILGGRFQWM